MVSGIAASPELLLYICLDSFCSWFASVAYSLLGLCWHLMPLWVKNRIIRHKSQKLKGSRLCWLFPLPFTLPYCLTESLMNTVLGRQTWSNHSLHEKWRGLGMSTPGDDVRHYPMKGVTNHVTALNLDFILYIDLVQILSVLKSDLYLNWSPSLWQVSSAVYITIHDI